MSQPLPTPAGCGTECADNDPVQIPGPAGADGTNGTDGSDGVNAYTVSTSQFTMPAELANVTVNVAVSSWISNGQLIFIPIAGYFQVVSKPNATSVILKNLSVVVDGFYTTNAPPGTIIPNASSVSAAGLQGAAGASGGGDLLAANNLNDVDSASDSRDNLGLGTIAVEAASDYLAKAGNLSGLANTATARDNLGVEIGVDVQAYGANLDALSGLTSAADKVPYFTGAGAAAVATFTAVARTLVAAATAVLQRAALGYVLPRYGLLGTISGANLNSAATDTAFTIESARYRIDKLTLETASTSVTTATAGLFTAAGGGGVTLAADQVLSALTASTKFKDLTLQAIAGTDTQTAATLYFRVGTAQGGACTANVFLFGWTYSP